VMKFLRDQLRVPTAWSLDQGRGLGESVSVLGGGRLLQHLEPVPIQGQLGFAESVFGKPSSEAPGG
jgi:hypothetical protein